MNDQKSESDGNKRAVNRRVQQVLTDMHQLRQRVQEQREVGEVEEHIHLQFQTALVTCHDVLRPYKNRARTKWENATEWEDNGLDILPKAVAAKPSESISSSGMGRFSRDIDYRPQLLDEWHLLQISYDIDEIASSIGFEPAPEMSRPDVHGGEI